MSTPYSWTIPTPPYEAPIYGTETWDTRYGLKGTGSGQDAQNIAIEPVSKHGVRYSSGQYQYEEVDLSAPINGLQWGHTRCYANRLLDGNDVYHGWLIKEHKKLSFTDWDIFGPAKICVVDSGSSSQFFERAGPDLYRPAFTGFDELHYESPNSEYVLKTSQGMQWGFYDNNAGNLAGCLKFIQDPYGRRTEAIYDSSGRLESFGDVFENAFLYAYDGSGLLESVTLVVDGDEVRRARYEYGTSANDLKFAYVEEKSDLVSGWALVRTTFYRYHEPSVYQQRLKDVIRGRSFVNMVAAYGDPEMIYDSTLAEHAVARLEYDAEGRVSSLKIRGTDDPEEHYAYEYVQLEVPSSSINIVHTQTVEKGPYNAEKTMYSNYAGQLVLSRLRDGSSSTSPDWYEYVTYNDRFQVLEVAKPSAIESADVSMTPSSLNWSITLKSEGLVHYREYHEENEFSSEPVGRLKAVGVKNGSGGTRVRLRRYSYTGHEAFGYTVYALRSKRIYSEEDEYESTYYDYSWHADGTLPTHQIEKLEVEYPEVDEDNNGTDDEEYAEEVYDTLGLCTWAKSPREIITKWIYDEKKLVPVEQVDDVDTSEHSDVPDGWCNTCGKNLVSNFEYDRCGRLTRSLAPCIEIDPETVDLDYSTAISVRPVKLRGYEPSTRHSWSAAGYFRMNGSTEEWTIQGPVTWELSDTNGDGVEEVIQSRAPHTVVSDPDDFFTDGALTPDRQQWVARTDYDLDRWGRVEEPEVYNQNYPSSKSDETEYTYNAMGLLESIQLPDGTDKYYVYDVRGLCTAMWMGTNRSGSTPQDPSGDGMEPDNNMQCVWVRQYDHGQGGGDGLLTSIFYPLNDSVSRVEQFAYDYRHRKIRSFVLNGDSGILHKYEYDDRNLLLEQERFHTSTSPSDFPPINPSSILGRGVENQTLGSQTYTETLTHRSRFYYDERGRLYRERHYGVDEDGDTSTSLDGKKWYDPDGHVIKSKKANTKTTEKFVYDSLGRLSASYLVLENETTSSNNTNDISDDTVIEETHYEYNEVGHLISQENRQRFDDTYGVGELQRQSDPMSRNSYVAHYLDPIGRVHFTADYGTNGGDTWERPDVHPERSDSILVTENSYSRRFGTLIEVEDPRGVATGIERDYAGRIIEEYKGDSDDDSQRVLYTYDDNRLVKRVNKNGDEEDQVTTWEYPTYSTSLENARYDLPISKTLPNCKTEYMEYNRQGELTKFTDANGTVHEYERDAVGRVIHDRVTCVGCDVDDEVLRISTKYNEKGLLELVTSYDDAEVGCGDVADEVAFFYNDYGMLKREIQSHWGDKDHADAKEVMYSYDEDSDERIVRRSHIVYPSGRTLEYQYDSGSISDALNRVAGLNGYAHNPSTGIITLGQFEYMGIGTPTKNTFPEPNLRHSWKMQPSEAVEDAGDQYTGYDRFGRVKRSRWFHEGSSLEPLVDLTWNYDRSSNKMQRLDLLAPSLARQDQAAEYDLQSRVTSWARGHYNASAQSLINDGEKEEFTYDRLGNWTNYKVYREAVLDIDQNRVHNEANQIVEVDGKSSKLDYDDNGNMTKFPGDRDLDGNVRKLIWDAWNRLRRVRNSNDVIVDWYGYDGLGRRKWHVYDNNSVYHRHYFYDDQGQIIEEGTHIDNQEDTYKIICQYVWHPGAQGQLIFRDRSVNNNGTLDERLYSLRDDMDVVAIADHSGQLLQRYHYTSFGLQRVMDTDFIELSQEYPSYDWTTLFHGHFLDKGRDIYCIGHRYYRPRLGRWLSQDPAGNVDGPNLYAYVNQNPLNRIDRTGLWAEAGHFYTTYAVAIAAGMNKEAAYRIAYYSQLPDEAAQFDAIAQATNAAKSVGHPLQQMWRHLMKDKAGEAASGKAVKDMTNIHLYLHYLRGSNNDQIKQSRRDLAAAIQSGVFTEDWKLGFAIHTLGDTYAHTRDLKDGTEAGYPTLSGHGGDGPYPDSIGQNDFNKGKYENFIKALYTALGGKNFETNADIQALLSKTRTLPMIIKWSHEVPNDLMHDWFVNHFGDRAPLNGYDPRGDGAIDPQLPIPTGPDVMSHFLKVSPYLR